MTSLIPSTSSNTCCDTPEYAEEEGHVVCTTCGTIGEQVLDAQPEWRFYGGDVEDPSRCGAPIDELFPESSYGIMVQSSRARDKTLIDTVYRNSGNSRERTMRNIFAYIRGILAARGLPNAIIDDATRIYYKQHYSCKVRAGNRNGMIASSVYQACNAHHYPLSMRDINDLFGFNMAHTSKACAKSTAIMKEHNLANNTSQPSSVADMSCKLASALGLDDQAKMRCLFVGKKFQDAALEAPHTPQCIAAALVQMVVDTWSVGVSSEAVTRASGISASSIVKCRANLEKLPHVVALFRA